MSWPWIKKKVKSFDSQICFLRFKMYRLSFRNHGLRLEISSWITKQKHHNNNPFIDLLVDFFFFLSYKADEVSVSSLPQ